MLRLCVTIVSGVILTQGVIMKRFSYFALSLVLGTSLAPAQYRAGLSSVGGTFDFSLPDSGPKSLTIAPSYSYSLSEKLAIGAEMFFSGEGELRMFGVAPFVRGNLPINDRAGVFTRASTMFAYVELGEEDFTGEDITGHVFGLGADAGLYYWISQRFSVELTLANILFMNTTVDVGDDEVADETDFSGTLSPGDVSLSVFYHF